MKKEILNILICVVLVIILTGCNNETNLINKAKIVDNYNNNVELVSNDLVSIYNENSVNFDKLYYKAKIDITEEYKSVTQSGNSTYLELKNNWIILCDDDEYWLNIISNLKNGDKVHFVGNIYGISSKNKVKLMMTDDSIIEIVE